jgi:carbon monoxide dehydrogenase subunit G
MELRDRFSVEAPIDLVWAHLLDVTKVAPCVPGAKLTETVDDTTWKGTVAVKLGPVSMSFSGNVSIAERDDARHHVVLKADGREQRGRGAASALVTADLREDGTATDVSFVTDLTITGAAAQYGRGMIQDISSKLTGQFADCVRQNIIAELAPAPASQAPAGSPPRAAAAPAKGIRLAVWAMWRAVVRFFRRLTGRAPG